MASGFSEVASRWAAVLAVVAAAGGWGAYFFTSENATALAQSQAREIRELKQGRVELEAAVQAERAKVAELKDIDTRLQTARQTFERTREAQEKAKAALAAAQNELSTRRTELATLSTQVAQTRQEAAKAEQAAAEQTASIEKSTPKKKRWTKRAKRGKRVARS
ncbi:MAG TPA: hypothetical protein VF744_08650 [Beijerinckiaceae bacterium]|jgi:chromosome segregation ATPase